MVVGRFFVACQAAGRFFHGGYAQQARKTTKKVQVSLHFFEQFAQKTLTLLFIKQKIKLNVF